MAKQKKEPSFNPDEFLAEAEAFDPDAFVSEFDPDAFIGGPALPDHAQPNPTGEYRPLGAESDRGAMDVISELGDQAWDATPDSVKTGLELAGRGLDYLGGLGRGAVGGVAEMATGKDFVDAEEVFKGKAPGYSEMMETAGVGNDYYARDIAGLGLDIATDPLTYATLGVSATGKLGKLRGLLKAADDKTGGIATKALRVAEEPTKKLGKWTYELPFRKVNKGAEDYARFKGIPEGEFQKPTDIMFRENMWGTAGSVDQQALGYLKDLKAAREEIINSNRYAPVDPNAMTLKLKKLMANASSGDAAYGKPGEILTQGKGMVKDAYERYTSQAPKVEELITRKENPLMRRGATKSGGNSEMLDLSTGDQMMKEVVHEGLPNYSTGGKYLKTEFVPAGSQKVSSRPFKEYQAYDPTTGKGLTETSESIERVVTPSRKAGTLKDADTERLGLNADLDSHYRSQRLGNKMYTDGEVKLKDAYRAGIREEQINSLNRVIPGEGDRWAHLGKEQGTLLSGHKGLGQDVSRLNNKPSFSAPDTMMAGAAAEGSKMGLAALAFKKARDVMLNPMVSTGSGVLLKNAAETGWADILARQAMIEATSRGEKQKEKMPWELGY